VLVDIYALTRPQISLVDAVVGLEGEGPSSRGIKRDFGLLFAGVDAVAVDAVTAAFMGYGPDEVPTTQLAVKENLGCAALEQIDIKGEALAAVRLKNLQKTRIFHYARFVPRWLVALLKQFVWVRPRADVNLCTLCRTCVRSCPVQAISVGDQRLVFDYELCINCLCCQELCPYGAIEMERSWLAERMH
jgi:ferredoxin